MKSVKIKIVQLPHSAGLPLPTYQSADAAGLDLMAAVPAGGPVVNTPGTVDSDYRGEIQVILVNFGSESFSVERGQRIAQVVIAPVFRAQLFESEKLAKTVRGAQGFGSTGQEAIDKKRKSRP